MIKLGLLHSQNPVNFLLLQGRRALPTIEVHKKLLKNRGTYYHLECGWILLYDVLMDAYISNGLLRPVTKGPGVSSNPTSKKSKYIDPFKYSHGVYTAGLKESIKKIVQKNFKSALIKYGENYLYFEVKNSFSKDDLEILLVQDKREVHFRSCAHGKIWGQGRNRSRVQKIKSLLEKEFKK